MTTTVFETLVGDLFADVARRVLADRTVRKSQNDRQFLKDVQRSQYGWKAPARLVALCERSADPVTRLALAEALRTHARAHGSARQADEPTLDLAETIAESVTNPIQAKHRLDPDNRVITRELCADLLRQEEATRQLRERLELELSI